MSLEDRLPGYRFGYVLCLLLVTFVFLAAAPTGDWVRSVTVVLEGLTLVAALFAARVRHVFIQIALVVAVLGLIASVATTGTTINADGAVAVLDLLLVGAAPVAIASSIIKRRVIDIHTVLGAICIYVLLGMLWAFLYTAISEMTSDPFFAQQATASTADFLYFSFVTLTTVGYGDLTATGGFGRAVAVLEALLGQIYLVTVVALLVSNLSRRRNRPAATARDAE
ncbi:MAG: potassium channel family protein [Acidimicrobiia bacterium]